MNANDANGQRALEALLAEAAADEQADFRTVWDLTGSVPEPGVLDRAQEERVWQALDSLIHTPEGATPDRPRVRRLLRLRAWMAVAASLLVGAAGLAWWLQPVTRAAPPGERLTVALPDGSRAELNGGATLRYARRFGRARAVYLVGEAFFDVVAGDRPFTVETFNARVEVLGTRFNVKAWPEGVAPATTVSLEAGRVALAAAARPGQAVEMKPGETRAVGPDAVVSRPDTTAIARALAWRTGALMYYDALLGVVLEDVERRFDVQLTLQVPALQRRRVSFSMHDPTDAEAVIRNLCGLYALNYRATATGYELYDSGMN